MNLPTSVTDSSDRDVTARISTDTLQQIAAPFAEAANDGEFYRNPLWIVVGAMAILAALLTCLVASG